MRAYLAFDRLYQDVTHRPGNLGYSQEFEYHLWGDNFFPLFVHFRVFATTSSTVHDRGALFDKETRQLRTQQQVEEVQERQTENKLVFVLLVLHCPFK